MIVLPSVASIPQGALFPLRFKAAVASFCPLFEIILYGNRCHNLGYYILARKKLGPMVDSTKNIANLIPMAPTGKKTKDTDETVHETPHDVNLQSRVDALLARKKALTINDVAALSGVSKKTVSRIINDAPNVKDETRKLVNDIIMLSGFSPDPQARGLAFRRAFLIGLIYDNPNAQYVVNFQMGILDHLRSTGNELVVHPCNRSSSSFLSEISDFIKRQRLSGVIILPPIAEDRDLLTLLDDLEVPYIRVTARKGELNEPPIFASQIVSLDRIGCAEASEHLAKLGHERIAFIGGNMNYTSAHERRAGFMEGLSRYGLRIEEGLDAQGDYSFESGYAAALSLLKRAVRPTAIISCNDEMSAGVYKAAHELGLSIPHDLSVVSFDDSPLASRLTPSLSTVRLPIRDMARQAAEALLNDRQKTSSFVFGSSFIERGSTSRPSANS